MNQNVAILINGKTITIPAESTVAAALDLAGVSVMRKSVRGEPRGPLCGIGICFECRVNIDGEPHQRACQTLCREGMEILTDA